MPLHLYNAENASGILLLSARLVAMMPRPPRSHRAARRTSLRGGNRRSLMPRYLLHGPGLRAPGRAPPPSNGAGRARCALLHTKGLIFLMLASGAPSGPLQYGPFLAQGPYRPTTVRSRDSDQAIESDGAETQRQRRAALDTPVPHAPDRTPRPPRAVSLNPASCQRPELAVPAAGTATCGFERVHWPQRNESAGPNWRSCVLVVNESIGPT